ncbi:MAG: DUF6714 family protein [Kiritimatiellales bacterium]|jgi:hypothetical protein
MLPEQIQLLDSISAAFPEGAAHSVLSLRQGDEIDSHNTPTPDALPVDWREVSERELEKHQWGFTHLDAESWRFYLPAFLAYSVRHFTRDGSLVIMACLNNLRPPDKVPSRFSTLTDSQRQAVISVWEFLTFGVESNFTANACQVLEEYWIERPLYPDA